jgi:hypothetical protein
MEQRFPTSSEISAALAALGVYAEVPSERDLAEQALEEHRNEKSR